MQGKYLITFGNCNKILCCSPKELKEKSQEIFELSQPFSLEMFDEEDFKVWVDVDDFETIPQKAKLRIKFNKDLSADLDVDSPFADPSKCSTFIDSEDYIPVLGKHQGDRASLQSQQCGDVEISDDSGSTTTSSKTVATDSSTETSQSACKGAKAFNINNENLISSEKKKLPWLLNYSLPKWPINIAQELENRDSNSSPISAKLSKKIGRIFFNSLCEHALYLTRSEYQFVCLELVRKYPCLADKDSKNPAGTWVASLSQRYRDLRRPLHDNRQVATKKVRHGFSKQETRRKVAEENDEDLVIERRNSSVLLVGDDVICDSDGEDETSIQMHIKSMAGECRKRSIDVSLLQDRMKRTFKSRRQEVCAGKINVLDLIMKYPALQFPHCIESEIERVVCFHPTERFKDLDEKIWKILLSNITQKISSYVEEACFSECEKVLLCLPLCLKEKVTGYVIEGKDDDFSGTVKSPYPILKKNVSTGFGLYIQRKLLCIIQDPQTAILTMLYSYWVFDIKFPSKITKTLSFLSYLTGIPCASTSKVQNVINQLK